MNEQYTASRLINWDSAENADEGLLLSNFIQFSDATSNFYGSTLLLLVGLCFHIAPSVTIYALQRTEVIGH